MADLTAPDLSSVPAPTATPTSPTLAAMLGLGQGGATSTAPAAPTSAPSNPASGLTQADIDWKARHSGFSGTAHDILGGLGDFLLTHLGLAPQYAKSQEQHKLNYAFDQGGQSSNPADQLNAVNQVEKVNFNEGNTLRNSYNEQQRMAASLASTQEMRNARIASAQEAVMGKVKTYAASMLGSMADWDDTKREQYWPAMRQQVLGAAQRQGVDLSGDLPEKFDPVALDAFTAGSVPIGMQRAQALTRDKNDNADQRSQDRIEEAYQNHDQQHEDRQSGQGVTMRGQDMRASSSANSVAASNSRNDARLSAKAAMPGKRPMPSAADITYLRNNPGARDNFDGNFGVGMSKRVLGN